MEFHLIVTLPFSHIGRKHMKKLHVDGFLESLDFESFDTCGTYLKMTKTLDRKSVV